MPPRIFAQGLKSNSFNYWYSLGWIGLSPTLHMRMKGTSMGVVGILLFFPTKRWLWQHWQSCIFPLIFNDFHTPFSLSIIEPNRFVTGHIIVELLCTILKRTLSQTHWNWWQLSWMVWLAGIQLIGTQMWTGFLVSMLGMDLYSCRGLWTEKNSLGTTFQWSQPSSVSNSTRLTAAVHLEWI